MSAHHATEEALRALCRREGVRNASVGRNAHDGGFTVHVWTDRYTFHTTELSVASALSVIATELDEKGIR